MSTAPTPLPFLKRLRARVAYRREDVMFITPLDAPVPPGTPDRLSVVPIRPEHRAALEAHVQRYHDEWRQSVAMIDDCYRRGFGGYVGLLEGEIVGYRWWSGRDHDHPHYALYGFRPAADEVYSFSLHVARPFRREGHASDLLGKMRKGQLASGFLRTYSVVSAENAASLRVQGAHGAREIGRRTVTRLLDRFEMCQGRLHRLDPVWS